VRTHDFSVAPLSEPLAHELSEAISSAAAPCPPQTIKAQHVWDSLSALVAQNTGALHAHFQAPARPYAGGAAAAVADPFEGAAPDPLLPGASPVGAPAHGFPAPFGADIADPRAFAAAVAAAAAPQGAGPAQPPISPEALAAPSSRLLAFPGALVRGTWSGLQYAAGFLPNLGFGTQPPDDGLDNTTDAPALNAVPAGTAPVLPLPTAATQVGPAPMPSLPAAAQAGVAPVLPLPAAAAQAGPMPVLPLPAGTAAAQNAAALLGTLLPGATPPMAAPAATQPAVATPVRVRREIPIIYSTTLQLRALGFDPHTFDLTTFDQLPQRLRRRIYYNMIAGRHAEGTLEGRIWATLPQPRPEAAMTQFQAVEAGHEALPSLIDRTARTYAEAMIARYYPHLFIADPNDAIARGPDVEGRIGTLMNSEFQHSARLVELLAEHAGVDQANLDELISNTPFFLEALARWLDEEPETLRV